MGKKHKTNGPEALLFKGRNNSYTKEFKQMVVEEYLKGEGSIENLAIKHQIPAPSSILNWISKYNNLKELKDYNPNRRCIQRWHIARKQQLKKEKK